MSAARNAHDSHDLLGASSSSCLEDYLGQALGRFYEDVLEAPLPPEIASLAEQLEARIRSSEGSDRCDRCD